MIHYVMTMMDIGIGLIVLKLYYESWVLTTDWATACGQSMTDHGR